jgi:hypothetical protein
MIYGFKNHKLFSEIKLLVLACMFDIWLSSSSNGQSSKSRWRRNLATSGHRNTDSAGLRRLPATVAGCRGTRFRLKLAGIRPNMFARIRQRRPNVAGFRRQLHFCLSWFFRVYQTSKNIFDKIIFFENDFIENILRRKPFYVETNRALITKNIKISI